MEQYGDWTHGNLRIRGKRENIIHFLQEELVPVYELQGGEVEERPIHISNGYSGWELALRRDPDTSDRIFFRGNDQLYIQTDYYKTEIEMSDGMNRNKDQVVFINDIVSTDTIDYEFLSEKAVRHKVDLRIYFWEPDIEWSNYITFYRNGTRDEASCKYSDWLWGSPLLNYR